jgi:hypothetical protein
LAWRQQALRLTAERVIKKAILVTHHLENLDVQARDVIGAITRKQHEVADRGMGGFHAGLHSTEGVSSENPAGDAWKVCREFCHTPGVRQGHVEQGIHDHDRRPRGGDVGERVKVAVGVDASSREIEHPAREKFISRRHHDTSIGGSHLNAVVSKHLERRIPIGRENNVEIGEEPDQRDQK